MATDEQIATAFNAAYNMQQTDPAMVEKLISTDNKDNEIMQAVVAGMQQAQREKIIEQQRQIKKLQQQRKHRR
ncbi:hypothetical protein ACVW0P_000685 [Mucilaginibacter sp. UYNi724]